MSAPATPEPKTKGRQKPPPSRDAFAFTLPDASAMTGLSESTLRRHAAAGRLKLLHVNGRTLAEGDSLRRLLGLAA